MKTRHFVLFCLVLLALGGCKSMRELKNLSKCQFRIGTVTGITLAGVNIQSVRKFSDLGFTDAGKVGLALASGSLPLAMNVNLEVKNPNKVAAGMNRMEWIAMIDDREILTGMVNERIEIQPNSAVQTIPVTVSVNLRKVLGSMGKTELLDFGMGMTDQSQRPVRVALKVKPTIIVGKHALDYPGYITVKREFTSQ